MSPSWKHLVGAFFLCLMTINVSGIAVSQPELEDEPLPNETPEEEPPTSEIVEDLSDKIKICSWNVGKLDVDADDLLINDTRDVLARNSCDIISLQGEIARAPAEKLHKRMTASPASFVRWDMDYSESFTILYRRDRVTSVGQMGIIDGSNMVRPPHVARFYVQRDLDNFSFVIMSVNVRFAREYIGYQREMMALRRDINNVRNDHPLEPDLVVVGTFWVRPSNNENSLWQQGLGSNNTRAIYDVTLAGGNRVADNIVWYEPTEEDYAGASHVDSFHQDFPNGQRNDRISKHLPIWATFWKDEDTR